jgi:hypothetical protein
MLWYIDLDEVLVDFTGGALAVHGWTRPQLEAARPPGLWSVPAAMGMPQSQFWNAIEAAGEDFWTELEYLPWAADLLRLLDGLDWRIVTSLPPKAKLSCYFGKLRWLDAHFNGQFSRCHLLHDKHLLARFGTVLIDDNPENVERFRAEGGDGIVFPSRGNLFYEYANDPVAYLKPLIRSRYAR